jgi:hypothetical protein
MNEGAALALYGVKDTDGRYRLGGGRNTPQVDQYCLIIFTIGLNMIALLPQIDGNIVPLMPEPSDDE